MEKKLSPVSEIIVDLDIMAEEAEKETGNSGVILKIFADKLKQHIIDSNFLSKERHEIEKACMAGLSGLPVSGIRYYEDRFANAENVKRKIK